MYIYLIFNHFLFNNYVHYKSIYAWIEKKSSQKLSTSGTIGSVSKKIDLPVVLLQVH